MPTSRTWVSKKISKKEKEIPFSFSLRMNIQKFQLSKVKSSIHKQTILKLIQLFHTKKMQTNFFLSVHLAVPYNTGGRELVWRNLKSMDNVKQNSIGQVFAIPSFLRPDMTKIKVQCTSIRT